MANRTHFFMVQNTHREHWDEGKDTQLTNCRYSMLYNNNNNNRQHSAVDSRGSPKAKCSALDQQNECISNNIYTWWRVFKTDMQGYVYIYLFILSSAPFPTPINQTWAEIVTQITPFSRRMSNTLFAYTIYRIPKIHKTISHSLSVRNNALNQTTSI